MTQPRLYWSPTTLRLVGSMMLSGLAQSRPLLTELAVDVVPTSDSPSVSASRQPMPKSGILTCPSGAIIRLEGSSRPWNSPALWAASRPSTRGQVVHAFGGADVDERHDGGVLALLEEADLAAGDADVPRAAARQDLDGAIRLAKTWDTIVALSN